jgi:hypothetical protein
VKRGTLYTWFIGIGLLTSIASLFVISPPLDLAVAETAGFAMLVIGLVGVTRQLFRSASDQSVEAVVAATDPLVIVEQEGLYRIGGHYERLIWWERPPKLVLDAGLREMPFLREFELWRGSTRMRLVRRKSVSGRWGYQVLFQYADNFGLTFVWFLFSHARRHRGALP